MVYVLDACALLSYLHDEDGSDIVEGLLKEAVNGDAAIYMSIVNLAEVHYVNIRGLGPERAAEMLGQVHAAPIQVIADISEAVFQHATKLKASYKCSLADAIGIATVVELSGYFVSSDHHELEAIAENESIPFLWLPPHPKVR